MDGDSRIKRSIHERPIGRERVASQMCPHVCVCVCLCLCLCLCIHVTHEGLEKEERKKKNMRRDVGEQDG